MANETTLDLDVNDAEELVILPDAEYELEILLGEVKTSLAGNQYVNIRFSVPEEMAADDIYHMMMLPKNEDTPKEANKSKLKIRHFCQAFDIDYTEGRIDFEAAVGSRATAILGSKTDDYGTKNLVRKFIVAA